jgi:hypothetical protein
MTTHLADEEVLETSGPSALALVADAEVDMQVATARRYPRSVTTFMRRATEMATLTPEIAASCIYALPRKEDGRTKNIEGPSARFAEICASSWGNLRAEGKVLGHDEKFVTARGTAWDVESNVAIAYEVKRRITNSRGNVYSDDMIGVTGNAGASIALRNAILKVIPTTFWKPIYNSCRKVIAGDQKTFASRRDGMLHEFAVMGVTEERLLASLGLKGKADITGDHMVQLAGFLTALKDGDTTIEEAFPESGGLGSPQPAQRKSQQQQGSSQTPAQAVAAPPVDGSSNTTAGGSVPAAGSTPAPAPASNIGLVVDIVPKGNATLIKLNTGFQAGTRDEAVVRGAQMSKDSGLRVELVTRPPKDPKYAPTITEIKPVGEGAQA